MMTEVAYLPLKSAGGAIVGHARIADGVCRLRFRRPVGGQAVVLGEDGTWFGAADEEIDVRGRICAVAVLAEGDLLCCGIPQGQKIGFQELKRRLVKPASLSRSAPIPPAEHAERPAAAQPFAQEPISEPVSEPVPQARTMPEDHPVAAPVPAPQDSVPTVTDGEPPIAARTFAPTLERTAPVEETAPSEPAIHTAILSEEPPAERTASFAPAAAVWDTEAADLPLIDPFAAGQQSDVPVISEAVLDDAEEIVLFDKPSAVQEHASLADSAADSEAFAALLRRAELVFESIESPAPPLLMGGKRSAAREYGQRAEQGDSRADVRPVRTAAGTAAQRSWGQEVDLLLGDRPAETRTAIENPFPHIFPGAVFFRIGGSGVQLHLEGDWVSGGERMRIYAVPGVYSPQPPAHLVGYTRFIRTLQGSFWVRVTGGR